MLSHGVINLYPHECTIKILQTHYNDILSILNRWTCSPLKLSFSEPTHWSFSELKEPDNLNPWLLVKSLLISMDECIYHHHRNSHVCLFIYMFIHIYTYITIYVYSVTITHTHICRHTHTHTHRYRILLMCALRAYNN